MAMSEVAFSRPIELGDRKAFFRCMNRLRDFKDGSFVINAIGVGAAEIVDLDCSRPIDEKTFQAIKSAFLDFPVLVVRDQIMSATDLANFGRRFGKLESYGDRPSAGGSDAAKPRLAALRQLGERETPDQMLYLNPDDPDVLIMSNEIRADLFAIGIVDNAEMWHSDASHRADPCQAIILHAIRNPSSGGDTEFCDMRAVYDALTDDIKAELAGRTTTHHWSKSKNPRLARMLEPSAQLEGERIAQLVPEMHQPVVRTHPETGRPSLFVSPRFTLRINDIAPARSDALLDQVFALAEAPQFHYRHRWRENDLVIWDNRCLNHRVRSYPSHDIRHRHRVTIAGDRPFYFQSAPADHL
jgi:taurine dioxygenase